MNLEYKGRPQQALSLDDPPEDSGARVYAASVLGAEGH